MEVNFFEPYKKQPQKTNMVSLIIICSIVLILGYMVIFTGMNYYDVYTNENQKKDYEAQMLDPSFIKKLNEIEKVEQDIKKIMTMKNGFGYLSYITTYGHRGNHLLLDMLSKPKTNKINYTMIRSDSAHILLEGISDSQKNIGILENDLRESKNFSDIFVQSYAISTSIDSAGIWNDLTKGVFNAIQANSTEYYKFTVELTLSDSGKQKMLEKRLKDYDAINAEK